MGKLHTHTYCESFDTRHYGFNYEPLQASDRISTHTHAAQSGFCSHLTIWISAPRRLIKLNSNHSLFFLSLFSLRETLNFSKHAV